MIHAHVDTGSETVLRLEQALLVYASEGGGPRRLYLEVRPVVDGPDGPEYGAGRTVDAEYVQRMLQRDGAPGLRLLGERLLAVGEDEAAWWAPAGRHAPVFSAGGPLAGHSGVPVAMPALLFHVRGRRLRVRALACRGRPGPGARLYVAPLWNVYRDGGVCMGSMPVPAGAPAGRTDAWEAAFWDSAFTTPHDPRACRHPDGYAAMLSELRTLPRFPARWLTPSKERMDAWLTRP